MSDISVLIADDQALVRGGFRMILDTKPGIEVVGEAAGTSMAELTRDAAGSHVHVVSPDASALAALLERAGGLVVSVAGDGALAISGLMAPLIGDLAAEHGFRVHELTPRRASLEAAFMELTEDSVEYRTEEVVR